MWIPILMSLGASAAQGYENSQVANQQDNILENNLRAQQGYQADVNKAVNGLLGGLKADSPAKAEKTSLDSYRKALDTALPVTSGEEVASGSGATAQSTLDAASRAFNLAGELAKVQAPQDMRRQDGYNLGSVQDVVNKYRNFAQGRQGLTDLALKGVGPDLGYAEIIGALQTAAQKYPIKPSTPPTDDLVPVDLPP